MIAVINLAPWQQAVVFVAVMAVLIAGCYRWPSEPLDDDMNGQADTNPERRALDAQKGWQ